MVDTNRSVAKHPARVGDQPSADAATAILDAADELFCSRGFGGVSVRDVAQAAGVKKASVFYHFGTKEVLFDRVLDRYYAAHAEALRSTRAARGSTRDRVHALLDAYMDFIEDHRRYVRLVHIEIAANGHALPRIRQGLARLHRLVAAALGESVPASGPLSARQFFVSFSGIVNTYALYAAALESMWKGDPTTSVARRERREHVHWVADALVDGLDRGAATTS